MKRALATAAALIAATPALAAKGDYPFFSLYNTDIVVAIAFVLFIGILVYFGVPGLLTGLLDKRADRIRAELDEARSIREEAQQVLASYERKQREVKEQADNIVARAREEATLAAEQARADIAASVERRLKAAEEQISSAEQAALRSVRNRAASIAIAAAGDVIVKRLSAESAAALIDEGLAEVEARLH